MKEIKGYVVVMPNGKIDTFSFSLTKKQIVEWSALNAEKLYKSGFRIVPATLTVEI